MENYVFADSTGNQCAIKGGVSKSQDISTEVTNYVPQLSISPSKVLHLSKKPISKTTTLNPPTQTPTNMKASTSKKPTTRNSKPTT